jgi:signal transduction histidine kinase
MSQSLRSPGTLPPIVIYIVFATCILPFFLNLIGVDFGSEQPSLDASLLTHANPKELVDTLHRSLGGSFTHTILEWSAFCAAIFTVVLAFAYYRIQQDVTTPIIGVALFCAGCMDAFHTLAADRLIEAVAPNENLIPFTWALCRMANVILTLLGVSIFFFKQPKQWQNNSLLIAGVTIIFGLLSYGVIQICAISNQLPQTLFPGSLITRPWDVTPLILFGIAGLWIYPRFYHQHQNIFSHSLVISTLPNVTTQLHMAFGSTALFDNHFNIAHGLKIVSYLVPLTGLVLNYTQTHYQLQVVNQELELEILERQKTQQELEASEQKQREKSQQLEQALENLKQAQLQIIQSEKMSSLGQLVAGVAHEINNPVSFIYGNLNYADEYVNDLFKIIQIYQETYPDSKEQLAAEIEALDLEFIQDDLPQLLNSMRVGADRIREIILSLRNFSRLDEVAQKEVALQEGIESTLMILQNRLKATPDRPAIEVVKDYGNVPPITCAPGPLNQVFMNILANGIDAIEEANQGKSFTEIEANPGRIVIKTALVEPNQISISIKDNGGGIPPEVIQKIYDPFFTTKSVGKGTGMGLAISHQIITETHQGEFYCLSQAGQGTEFVIKLPIAQQPHEQPHE